MPQWNHNKTKKPAVLVGAKLLDTAIEIKTWEDLPELIFWEQFDMKIPELFLQGTPALFHYLGAFNPKQKPYYINIFPSGFPDGVVTNL